MFNTQEDDNKNWLPYIVGMTITALLSAAGIELVHWGVDELRTKFGTKKPITKPKPSQGKK